MEKKTVLAISGSLRNPSFTEKMLDLFIEGMGDGLDVKKFYPHKMNISPCVSCYSCWGKKNPGVCVKSDDFNDILETYKNADYFLMAFPLYFFGFPATVKNVIDRLFILLESPQIIGNCGTTCHPIRFDRHPKTVLISSCGFPEIEHFDIVRRHFKKICDEAGWPLAGEILISAAGAVNIPGLFDKKFNCIKEAGSAFMQGNIGRDIQEEISKPVISDRDYREMVTAALKGGITGRIKSTVIGTKAIIKSKME